MIDRLPIDFTKRMKEYLGEEYDAFIASYEKPEIKGLRLNNEAPREFLGAVFSDGSSEEAIFSDIPWLKNGFSYTNDVVRPGKHPYHEAGVYYIQEPSAMAPAVYLDVKPGERVLDLCAAPGGKSTQLGAMLEGKGILVSNEIMPDRAKILSENIERMGISNALVISEDPRNISDRFAGYFDKILVDAPCSGEGMFRRSDVAINEWSLDNVATCADRQSWILDEAAKMLRPGGTIVYSTCTFAKEEDEEQIKSFLERNNNFVLAEMELYGRMREGYDNIGVRIWPHLVEGEGHYVCKIHKKNYLEDNSTAKNPPVYGYETDLSKKDRESLKEMYEFFKKNIKDEDFLSNRRLTRFKDQIYMLPEECPSLKGMKVLRPGLHLGTILKNRFEPGHALARILGKDDVTNTCVLRECDIETRKFLRGETFNVTGENGWSLVLVDEYSMGWGKIANGIMKNHYPKGLRKDV